MGAVNEQLRNFEKTGINGDGRTIAELAFEENLKVGSTKSWPTVRVLRRSREHRGNDFLQTLRAPLRCSTCSWRRHFVRLGDCPPGRMAILHEICFTR